MFRWIPEATQEQKQRVTAELSRLPALLPVLRAYHMGADLGVSSSGPIIAERAAVQYEF